MFLCVIMEINLRSSPFMFCSFLAYFRFSSVDGHELVSHSGGGSVRFFFGVLLIKAGFNQDI